MLKILLSDSAAAFTVALLAVPQSVAYSLITGLPLSASLFAAIVGTLIQSSFGSCKYLVCGSSTAIALLIQAATATVMNLHYPTLAEELRLSVAISLMCQITLLVGLMQLGASILKLGKLTHFVSRSVIVGYLVGTGLTIIVNQLPAFAGMSPGQASLPLYAQIASLFTRLDECKLVTLALGLAGLVGLQMARKSRWQYVAPTIMLAILSIVSTLLLLFVPSLFTSILLLPQEMLGAATWPTLHAPILHFSLLNELLPPAFAITLLSVIEATSVARTLGTRAGETTDINKDVWGLALANLAGALVGALPTSGSASRSQVNYATGAKTRAAALMSSFFCLLLYVSFSTVMAFTPQAALAALLIYTALHMVDPEQLKLCFRTTREDAAVLLMTIGACLLFSLDVAFYIGVVMSIVSYLSKAAVPDVAEYTIDTDGELRQVTDEEKRMHPHIRIIDIEGDLFFGATDLLHEQLTTITANQEVRVLILSLTNAHHMDATVCLALGTLNQSLTRKERLLILCGVTPNTLKVLMNSGLFEELGAQNVFVYDGLNPQATTHQAVARAKTWMHNHEAAQLDLFTDAELTATSR